MKKQTLLIATCCLLAGSSALAAASAVTNALSPGTRFATHYYVHDAGTPGPTVMIVGGAHGNEPAGAAAAEAIRHWPIHKGKLVVIPRSNIPALAAGKRYIPNLGTNLNNLNRNYPRVGKDEPARGEIAIAIWDVAQKFKPDWLLDLHEGYDFNRVNNKSVGSSVIASQDAGAQAAATLILAAVNETIPDDKIKFTRRGPTIDSSLARAASGHLKIPTFTLETTSKQPLEKRVQQHEIMVHRLLNHIGMMGDTRPTRAIFATSTQSTATTVNSSASSAIRIALYKGPGTGGAGPPNLMKRLNNGHTTSITQVSPEEIQNGALTNFHAVIFAGGSAGKQAAALGETGRDAVRAFVSHGGGYIGICAGAYLATSGFSWSLKIINARTVSPKWMRGVGDVKMELVASGEKILGDRDGQFDVHYANGPIVEPAEENTLPPYEALAFFRTELAKNGSPEGVMVDSPAIFSGQFEQGRVVCISPHPEQTKGLEDFVPRAINWAASKEATASKPSLPKAE